MHAFRGKQFSLFVFILILKINFLKCDPGYNRPNQVRVWVAVVVEKLGLWFTLCGKGRLIP